MSANLWHLSALFLRFRLFPGGGLEQHLGDLENGGKGLFLRNSLIESFAYRSIKKHSSLGKNLRFLTLAKITKFTQNPMKMAFFPNNPGNFGSLPPKNYHK